jgi:hypothetical protein
MRIQAMRMVDADDTLWCTHGMMYSKYSVQLDMCVNINLRMLNAFVQCASQHHMCKHGRIHRTFTPQGIKSDIVASATLY